MALLLAAWVHVARETLSWGDRSVHSAFSVVWKAGMIAGAHTPAPVGHPPMFPASSELHQHWHRWSLDGPRRFPPAGELLFKPRVVSAPESPHLHA